MDADVVSRILFSFTTESQKQNRWLSPGAVLFAGIRKIVLFFSFLEIYSSQFFVAFLLSGRPSASFVKI
jgi:hypothetical protein